MRTVDERILRALGFGLAMGLPVRGTSGLAYALELSAPTVEKALDRLLAAGRVREWEQGFGAPWLYYGVAVEAAPMTCILCNQKVESKDVQIKPHILFVPLCPHCHRPTVLRTRTALGSVVWCQGSSAGSVYNALHFDTWTPDELEAIAADLRAQEQAGALFHSDGSGTGEAGRWKLGGMVDAELQPAPSEPAWRCPGCNGNDFETATLTIHPDDPPREFTATCLGCGRKVVVAVSVSVGGGGTP